MSAQRPKSARIARAARYLCMFQADQGKTSGHNALPCQRSHCEDSNANDADYASGGLTPNPRRTSNGSIGLLVLGISSV